MSTCRQQPAATRHFAGRDEAVKALAGLAAEAAGGSPATVICVIHGTAGIGKTTLAVHFAHQAAGQFPDGQLYVNLRGFDPAGVPVNSQEALRLLLGALSVPAAKIPAGLDAQAGLYRSLLAGQRMLVLLDNARDVDQVRPLLPASPGCLVIVTSRNQLTSLVAAEGAFPLTLDVLADAEAHELLARRLGPQLVADDPAATDELIQLCARLPLALSIAAARTASQPGLSLAGLAADLRDARRRLDALDTGHAATNVRAVLSWSYQQLDPVTARLFRLLRLHAGPDGRRLAAAASMAGAGLSRRHAAAAGRAAPGDLQTEHATGRYSSHDLLRAYADELAHAADSEAERHAATGRIMRHFTCTRRHAAPALLAFTVRRRITLAARLSPGVTPEHVADTAAGRTWFRRPKLRVLMAAAERAAEAGFRHAGVAESRGRCGGTWNQKGRWHDWVKIEQCALAATQRLGDPSAHALAHQRFGYAGAEARQVRRGRLRPHAVRALSIPCQSAGSRRLDRRTSTTRSLSCSYRPGPRRARPSSRPSRRWRLTPACGDAGGAGPWPSARSAGCTRRARGPRGGAAVTAGQAAGVLHEIGNREGEASTLDSLGHAHQQLGNHAESVTWYQCALDLYDEIGHRWGYAETLGHLGDARHAAGDLAGARADWEQSLAVLDDLDHPDADRIRAKLSGF